MKNIVELNNLMRQLTKTKKSNNDFLNYWSYYLKLMPLKQRLWLKKQIAGLTTANLKIEYTRPRGGFYAKNKIINPGSSFDIKEQLFTFFHEFGHYVHFYILKQENSITYTAKEIMKKEFLLKKKEVEAYLKELTAIACRSKLDIISDSLGIMFQIDVFALGYRGHYLDDRTDAGYELFANFFAYRMLSDNKQLTLFKKEFPKTYFYLNTKINNLFK